jgi:hypothetical protein
MIFSKQEPLESKGWITERESFYEHSLRSVWGCGLNSTGTGQYSMARIPWTFGINYGTLATTILWTGSCLRRHKQVHVTTIYGVTWIGKTNKCR